MTTTPPPASKGANLDQHHVDSFMSNMSGSRRRIGGLRLYSRPIQRQRWQDRQVHPVVNYGDLFFDLFYVSAAYNLGNLLRLAPSADGLLYFVATFFCVFLLWQEKLQYDARFYAHHDNLFHRFLDVALLVSLATSVVHIRTLEILSTPLVNAEMFVFCLGVTVGSFIGIIRQLEVMFFALGEPAAKASAKRELKIKTIPFLFLLAATILSGVLRYHTDSNNNNYDTGKEEQDHNRFLAGGDEKDVASKDLTQDVNHIPVYLLLCSGLSLLLIWFITLFTLPPNGEHKKITVPLNVDFAIHRYSEWIMLVLGESVLSLLIVDVDEDGAFYTTFYCGILSVILLQYMHFRSQPHSANDHAMRRSKEAGFTWSILMQVFSASLIALGAMYKAFLYEFTYNTSRRRALLLQVPRWLAGESSSGSGSLEEVQERRQRIANIFCGSMAIVWFCSDAMILTHKGIKHNLDGRCKCMHTKKVKVKAFLFVLLRVGLWIFMACLGQITTSPEILSLVGLFGVVAQVIIRILPIIMFPDDRIYNISESEKEEKKTYDDRKQIFAQQESSSDKWPNITHARAERVDTPPSIEEA